MRGVERFVAHRLSCAIIFLGYMKKIVLLRKRKNPESLRKIGKRSLKYGKDGVKWVEGVLSQSEGDVYLFRPRVNTGR